MRLQIDRHGQICPCYTKASLFISHSLYTNTHYTLSIGQTPHTNGNTSSMNGNTPNTSGNISKGLLNSLREACVINPRDNKRFIPHRKLKAICNHQAVVEALASAFPEKDGSFHKKYASKVCLEQTPASTVSLQKGPHATIASDCEFDESTIQNESTVYQQATTKNGTVVQPKNSHPCHKIFAILVLIDQVRLIESFLDHPLCDNDLPLSSTQDFKALWSPKVNPMGHVKLPDGYDHYDIIKRFTDEQWSVLAPCFDAHITENMRCKVYEFHENEILPIEEVSKTIYLGGFGMVEKVKIHREHNGFVSLLSLTRTHFQPQFC